MLPYQFVEPINEGGQERAPQMWRKMGESVSSQGEQGFRSSGAIGTWVFSRNSGEASELGVDRAREEG